jgi:hypothetical protein
LIEEGPVVSGIVGRFGVAARQRGKR